MTYTYIEARSNYHRGSILILRYAVHQSPWAHSDSVDQLFGTHRRILLGAEQRSRGYIQLRTPQGDFPIFWTILYYPINKQQHMCLSSPHHIAIPYTPDPIPSIIPPYGFALSLDKPICDSSHNNLPRRACCTRSVFFPSGSRHLSCRWE